MEHKRDFDLPVTSLLQTLTTPLPSVSPTERKLRNGELVAAAGNPFLGLITIQAGQLKRYRLYQSRPFLTGLAGPGEVLGLEEAIAARADGETRCQRETLEAVGETVILIEPMERVETLLASLPKTFLSALRGTNLKTRLEDHLRRPLELLPVRARVAATLWLLAERHGRIDNLKLRVIDLDLTREEVAHLAGTVYESVIRTLTSLKKEGVIDLNGRVIRILNEDQLARIGQIVAGEPHDQVTVSQNHNSSNNGHPKEAC